MKMNFCRGPLRGQGQSLVLNFVPLCWTRFMTLSHQPPRQVRFGEFALDLPTAELRTKGHKLILQTQPFQVLVVLLEHPGQLVSREEMTRRLWPSGTYVDFDLGLNKVVNRLRQTLGDSADHPRFIETLPRKGYRFIGSVKPLLSDQLK